MSLDETQTWANLIVIVNAVAVFSGMTINFVLRRRIRSLNYELGFGHSIEDSYSFLRYILGSGHRELNDPIVNRLAFASKIALSLVALFLASFLGLIFWSWHVHPIQSNAGEPTHNHPLNRYGVAILGVIAVWFAAIAGFLRYVRQQHSQTWKELESPSLFLNNTPSNNWKLLRFIWSAQHKSLGDPNLTMAVYAIRLLLGGTFVALLYLGPLAAK
jgi:hypothetical protein